MHDFHFQHNLYVVVLLLVVSSCQRCRHVLEKNLIDIGTVITKCLYIPFAAFATYKCIVFNVCSLFCHFKLLDAINSLWQINLHMNAFLYYFVTVAV